MELNMFYDEVGTAKIDQLRFFFRSIFSSGKSGKNNVPFSKNQLFRKIFLKFFLFFLIL